MLTKIIRGSGVMKGKITYAEPTDEDRAEAARYRVINPVMQVSLNAGGTSAASPCHAGEDACATMSGGGARRIALIDYGAKGGIEDALLKRDCEIARFGYAAEAGKILSIKPDGVVLSNGPGDPADPANAGMVETIRALVKNGLPILGICLGHQLLALANGFKTHKMK